MLTHSMQEREVDACENQKGEKLEGESSEENVCTILVGFEIIGRNGKGSTYSLIIIYINGSTGRRIEESHLDKECTDI